MNNLEFQSFIEKQLQSEKILHSYMFYGENIEEYNEQILLFLYSTIIKKDIFKEYNITKKSDYNIIREKENLYNQILSGVVEEFKILDGKEMKVQDVRNAFSSVYEKPPFYVTIILTSKTLNGILDTIKSRCQKTYLAEKIENRKIVKENILSEVIDDKIKDDILNILENIIYDNSMIYNRLYKIVVETRRRVKSNCNFEMTKDYLILNIWDEINI